MLRQEEELILDSIIVASEDDPTRPEFPPQDPKFPATPCFPFTVPGFSNVWLKDESHNPTGTHKDRMAWEVVVTYRQFLLAKKKGQLTGPLPHMSIISSGSAAIAIQTQLRHYGLPYLKVLVDNYIDPNIFDYLSRLGCKVYRTDLSCKVLYWQDILRLTDNLDGLDITSSEALDPTTRFYDWLSYEILNMNPEVCFIPFGTGNLYENVLNVNKKEILTERHDPRFSGDIDVLRRCDFYGATTNNADSKADKLHSPHLPFVHFDEQWIRFYRYAGYCGPRSGVSLLREDCLEEAYRLASAQDVDCEPSGIAGLALLLQMKDEISADAKILIVNTGRAHVS